MARDVYNDAFYEAQKSGSYRSAQVVVPLVMQLLPVGSVCDVGCGLGTWLRCWQEQGVAEIFGMDGHDLADDKLMIPGESFRRTDLRLPIASDRRFDLVTSLEVAEHLPEARAASFVEDLTKLAPVVLFSAAVPGQGGISHVNERWQSYWAELFAQHDYLCFDVLRQRIWSNEEVQYWYRQNILLFCRRDAIAAYPALAASAARPPLSVIHPLHALTRTPTVKEAATMLAGSIYRGVARRLRRFLPALPDVDAVSLPPKASEFRDPA